MSRTVEIILRLFIGLLLLLSGTLKYFESPPNTIYHDMIGTRQIGHILFCAFEIGLALWVLFERRHPYSVAVALFLFALFVGIIVGERFRAKPRSCGCFGRMGKVAGIDRSPAMHVSMNLIVMGACVGILLQNKRSAKIK